jgi:hypothetical protein
MARAASGRSFLLIVTAASLDRAWGRHTWQGSRDRWHRGAVRSARVRCGRSGTARTRRRVRTATPWHRAQRRPRPPTREQTCWGGPPIGRLPALSRTSRPPLGIVVPGTPGNASHCRRRSRPRRLRHRLPLGEGHRGELDRGWLRPEPGHRRPSCRRGRHCQPRRAHHAREALDLRQAHQARHGAHCEGRGWVMRPSKTGTPGSRGLRRSPR